ncbi:cupin domain-containing protein [Tahibacter soli]|uniref:Cupin domain-containing protein n=1 Tax=Tahibacter soli TaxID=2983605 RepID=A0A9X4BIT6_9GAMM|nr:cupin domain-containing protein [Tahibacter soli]MDC8011459.1 cupin domain-containing protein [Tahibacter soli]
MTRLVLILAAFAAGTALADGPKPARLVPDDIAQLASTGPGTGTSGVAGIRSVVLSGDPAAAGLYTIRVIVPPHTTIRAHTHRDARSATVVAGRWYFGYGDKAGADARALPPGSFYTEPANAPHYAQTRDEGATVDITGYGPSDTVYVEAANDPRDAK